MRPDHLPKPRFVGPRVYTFKGVVVDQIAWAKEHGEQVVVLEWTIRTRNPFNGQDMSETMIEDIPSSWVGNFVQFGSMENWTSKELGRYDP